MAHAPVPPLASAPPHLCAAAAEAGAANPKAKDDAGFVAAVVASIKWV